MSFMSIVGEDNNSRDCVNDLDLILRPGIKFVFLFLCLSVHVFLRGMQESINYHDTWSSMQAVLAPGEWTKAPEYACKPRDKKFETFQCFLRSLVAAKLY